MMAHVVLVREDLAGVREPSGVGDTARLRAETRPPRDAGR
jgi:hypothetical protein